MRMFLLSAILLAACGESRPPAPTAEQSDQLNEAEAMLNELEGNEEGPEVDASGPSRSE